MSDDVRPEGSTSLDHIEVDGVLRPARNNLGQPIHPSLAGVRNFWRWFAGSLATDPADEARPHVMYHASYRDFTAFNRLASTAWRRPSMDTIGLWFSDTPSDEGGAGMYVSGEGAAIYPVYLCITRPKVYDSFDAFLNALHEAAGRDPATQNPKGVGSTDELRDLLRAQGYDGIAFTRTHTQELLDTIKDYQEAAERAKHEEYSAPRCDRAPYTMKRKRLEDNLAAARAELHAVSPTVSTEFDKQVVWVAFDPEQIKSAIGNSGAFHAQCAEFSDHPAQGPNPTPGTEPSVDHEFDAGCQPGLG